MHQIFQLLKKFLFDIFDLNRDGGLNRQELAAFLLVTDYNAKHGEEHIGTCVDDVFWYYDKYIDGEKGLTCHGLLDNYDDHRGFNTAKIASHKSLFEKTSGLFVRVFDLYHKFVDNKRGLTIDSLLKMASDDGASESEKLGIVLKHHIDDEVALWFSSPKSLVAAERFTNSPKFLLYFFFHRLNDIIDNHDDSETEVYLVSFGDFVQLLKHS